jgi:polyhydroxyalkanoate synthase
MPLPPPFNYIFDHQRLIAKRASLLYLSMLERLIFGEELKVGQTESQTICETGKARVIRYEPRKRHPEPTPVLIITPILSKPYILDLYPGLSLVEYLVEEGLDVYLIDFGEPDLGDMDMSFEDYVFHIIPESVEAVLRTSQAAKLSLIGYCFGGVFTLLYEMYARKNNVSSIVLVATPVDFSKMGLHYHYWRSVNEEVLVNTFGNIPPELIINSFHIIAWMEDPLRYVRRLGHLLKNLKDKDYLKKELLITRWLIESPPFPAGVFRQLIRELFRKNSLVTGTVRLDGREATLSSIKCPVFVVSHTSDVVSPPESARALLDLIGSKHKELLEVSGGGAGHIDVIVGSEGQEITWPRIASWLKSKTIQSENG